jgi:DNA-binding MarR family transcriptional regulator
MKSCLPDDIPLGAAVSVISRSKSVFFNNRLRPHGLSAGQVPVLLLLAREQNIMQDRLVRHYHLDKGTIARAVRKLEDGGFLHRTPDPGNRRAVRLFLTGKGEEAIPLLQSINREWEEQAGAGLSAGEMASLRSLLHRMAQNGCAILETDGGDGDD